MRLLSFILFLIFIFFAIFARHYFVCDILKQCEEEQEEIIVDQRAQTLVLTDNDSIILEGYDQFAYDTESYDARMNESNEAFLDTLAQLMMADSNSRLTLTGFYSEQEIDIMAGFYDNMGLARAANVRKMLVKRGVDENRMDLDHGIATDSLISEPLTFQMYKITTPSEYAKTAYTFTNMTFSDANFEVNSYVFKPGESFVSYADSLKIYLSLNTDKQLLIIGHTDSDASNKYNKRLGLNRAKSAKKYFEDLGVENEIEVLSKGETEPVVPNTTAANKQKNRRVNFVID